MSFQHNTNSSPEGIHTEELCSAEKLDSRNSLLTCCTENIEGSSHVSVSPATLTISPLRMKCSSPDALVIRDSKGLVIAIGQFKATQRATLFGTRPLFQGQAPSLTLGGLIMYHLGHVVVSDDNSGTLYLLSNEIMAVNRNRCGSLELTRTSKVCKDIREQGTNVPMKKDTNVGSLALSDDNILTLCMEAVFDKILKR